MLNPFADVEWKPDFDERRKFARSLLIGFPIVAFLLEATARMVTHAFKPFPLWVGGIGIALGAMFWVLPGIVRPFYVVWYAIACSIGFIVGNVLLSAVFYLVLTPIGLIMRICGKPPLSKRFDGRRQSYWEDAPRNDDASRYYRQF